MQAAWSSASASNLESEDHAANAAGGGLEETEMFFYYEEENPKTERIDHRKEIIKIINSMSGSRSGYEIFSDWVRCMAIAIENSTHVFRNEI